MDYRINALRFRKLLAQQGYASMAQFGERHHIHRNTIHHLLSGKNVFTASVDAVAKALHVDPLELIEPVSEIPPSIQFGAEIAPIIGQLVGTDSAMAVFLLGSRSRGDARQYSDWDIGITRYPSPISGNDYLRLKDQISEWSEDLPRIVDLINLDQAPAWFLQNIGKPIFLAGNETSHIHFKGVLDGIERQKQ